jgi:outer membrane protein OmpA-like peptidoglycan-associated protein
MIASLIIVLSLMSPAPGEAIDTTIVLPAPDEGVVRLTYGQPRMRVVPGHARATGGRSVDRTSVASAMDAESIHSLTLSRLEQLINRRFDRLEALSGMGGRGLAALLQYVDTDRGPALLMQPEGRLTAAPDTIFLADGLSPDQVRMLDVPAPVRPSPPRTSATLRQPGDPIVLGRRSVEEQLFPAVRVNFEFDGSSLLGYADPTLDAIGEAMVRHPWLRLEVSGHTDNVGSASYNQQLSEERAEAARSYILNRFDIEPTRMVAVGHGFSQPLTRNRTETERAVNRRVEFRVLNSEDDTLPAAVPDDDEIRRSIQDAVREAMRESLGESRQRDDSDIEW